MQLDSILNEAPSISEDMKSSFNNIFARIQNRVKDSTEVSISPKWVAGLLNQYHMFKHLDKMLASHEQNGNEAAAKDTKARIIARDVLAKLGLLDKGNGYLPKQKPVLSLMRQYYTSDIHDANQAADATKSTRVAGDDESQDWIASLTDEQKNYVKNLQELNPEELAAFKHVLHQKEHKKEFMLKLHEWGKRNDVAKTLLSNIGLIQDGKLSAAATNNFRAFLAGLTNARLKDVLSKASIYAGKKITHDTHRSKNAVLKSVEKQAHGKYSKMLRLYHYVSERITTQADKDRAFRRALDKMSVAHDADGKPNVIGKGAYKLFKAFGGKQIDMTSAISELDKAYKYPADRSRRAQKAETRGDGINKVADI